MLEEVGVCFLPLNSVYIYSGVLFHNQGFFFLLFFFSYKNRDRFGEYLGGRNILE